MVPETKKIVGEIQKQMENINTTELSARMRDTVQQVGVQMRRIQIDDMSDIVNVDKKGSMISSEKSAEKLENSFQSIKNIVKNVTSQLGKMGSSIIVGVKNVLKYAMSLFSIQNIYGNLKSLGQNWLSSQDSGAKQLSTNIEYMKDAMGSSLAPIISYVTNLFYTLLKAVQNVVYALFKVNIFANLGAKAYANMTNSAKKTKDINNGLSGIHGEINNVSIDRSNDSVEGENPLIPTVDLSLFDSEITPLQQKIADFFRPLVDSWQTYSPELISKIQETIGQIGSLFGSISQSFVNSFSNGTVYSILGNIFGIIGNIAEAFSNAWNYNGNGDAIVQNLADTFNTLLGIMERIAGSRGFQLFLDGIISAFNGISTLIKPVIEDFFRLLEPILKIAMSGVGVILDIIGKAFKFIGENEIIVSILEALAIAIGLVNAALKIYSIIEPIIIALKGLEISTILASAAAWFMANIPILLVIAAITAIIAIVILCIKHWEELGNFLSSIWEGIKQKAVSIWEGIKNFFMTYFEFVKNLFITVWNTIKDFFIGYFELVKNIFINVWNTIKDFFIAYFETVKNIFVTVWNIISGILFGAFDGIRNTITTILNTIFSIWSNIWDKIKNVITNVWNGIWGTIKGIINLILTGIEGMVNAIIKGVNFILSGISSVASAVGSIIGLDPINLQLNTISLPRLAKGGIIRNSTLALMGEYIGASQNPEIVTPQNLMYDTFTKALKDNSNSENPIEMNLVIQLGAEKIYQKFIEFVNYQSRVNGISPLSISI